LFVLVILAHERQRVVHCNFPAQEAEKTSCSPFGKSADGVCSDEHTRCRYTRIGNTKPLFRPAAATARLHRRPLRARSDGGTPSTQRLPAAAVRG
jgi:hypothetical protein